MGVFLFFLLATVCVAAVVAMIVTRNQAYSALYLVLVFAALGGLFGLLDAPFIAAVQIIIYAGAIMVLFIFVIMLVNLEQGVPPDRKKWAAVLASVLAAVLLAELLLAVRWTFFEFGRTGGEPIGRPVTLGRLLFTEYLYPFEITSILIVAALVGAIVLAKKERPDGMIPVSYFFVLSLVLFALGVVAFFVRRDVITMFMAVEVMLNAANLAFVALARSAGSTAGQVIVFFVITVAAAEAAVGLAIILLVFRQKKSVRAEDMNLMKG